MNTKYYNLFFLGFILILSPSLLWANNFKISDPYLDSSFRELITSDNGVGNVFSDWEYVNRIKGINSFQKNMPAAESKAYKGVCIINSPIKTIYSIIADVNNHSKWIKFCKSSRGIGKQAPSKSTQYYQFAIPWPFSNRDMVINTTTDINWESGRVTISSFATGNSDIPHQEEFIRVIESKQRWTLERISPTSTKVTFTSYTPLAHSDSSLIKQIVAMTMPLSTLEQLKVLSATKHEASGSKYVVKSDADFNHKKKFKSGS